MHTWGILMRQPERKIGVSLLIALMLSIGCGGNSRPAESNDGGRTPAAAASGAAPHAQRDRLPNSSPIDNLRYLSSLAVLLAIHPCLCRLIVFQRFATTKH